MTGEIWDVQDKAPVALPEERGPSTIRWSLDNELDRYERGLAAMSRNERLRFERCCSTMDAVLQIANVRITNRQAVAALKEMDAR